MDVFLLDKKLSTHTEGSVNHREPGILQLAKTYNDLCEKLRTLSKAARAPRNAILPQPVKTQGLFELDVDDEIWQDTGLGDDECHPTPPWLVDQDVRDGIKLCLELDRCREEETRLRRERVAMQEWLREEWECLIRAEGIHGECPCSSHARSPI